MSVLSSYPVVNSAYMSNISKDIVSTQRKVFNHLGIPLEQHAIDGLSHGDWLTKVTREAETDVVMFCDIDAFPLSKKAYHEALLSARSNKIFGLAQTANHLRPMDIYAGPVFLAFKKSLYSELGSPSLSNDDAHDAAQRLTDVALIQNIPVELKWPSAAIVPKWPLADRGIFGIGTFYGEADFFHLFQARYKKNIDLLKMVAEDVLNRRTLNFKRYLEFSRPPSFFKTFFKNQLSL